MIPASHLQPDRQHRPDILSADLGAADLGADLGARHFADPIWVPGTSPAGALWLGRELPWLGSVQLFRNTELRPGPLLLEAVAGCFVPLIAYLAGAEVVVGSKGV